MNQVANNKVVSIRYKLLDERNTELESGEIDYLHGHRNLMPALESFLAGKKETFSGKVSLNAKDAFGEFNKDLVMTVPKTSIDGAESLTVGQQVEAEMEGEHSIAFVKEINADTVILDANHPYSGKNVQFDLEVLAVRDATAQELAHGHAHGAHGHHH